MQEFKLEWRYNPSFFFSIAHNVKVNTCFIDVQASVSNISNKMYYPQKNRPQSQGTRVTLWTIMFQLRWNWVQRAFWALWVPRPHMRISFLHLRTVPTPTKAPYWLKVCYPVDYHLAIRRVHWRGHPFRIQRPCFDHFWTNAKKLCGETRPRSCTRLRWS